MSFKIKFWGVRGSIPCPGPKTVRYGGNTACVEMRCGGQVLICDCGTGLRELGEQLMKEFAGKPLDIDIFIGHTHWDHIQGFPFFIPAYIAKNKLRVYSVKAVGADFEHIFKGQMGANYFPVEISDMAAQMTFTHAGGDFQAGKVQVRTMFTNHPGVNLAFRFEAGGCSVTYLTDHEKHVAFAGDNDLTRRQDAQIEDFCRGTDLLICDSQYTDEEYKYKRGWGHNRWRDTMEIAVAAEVRRLALFHHDPTRTDEELDRIQEACREMIAHKGSKVDCFAAREGQEIELQLSCSRGRDSQCKDRRNALPESGDAFV